MTSHCATCDLRCAFLARFLRARAFSGPVEVVFELSGEPEQTGRNEREREERGERVLDDEIARESAKWSQYVGGGGVEELKVHPSRRVAL